MPVTYVIAVFFLRMLDFTLNLSTLLAVGLSVGVLVTNSIVVLERIIARLDELGDPREAARVGAADVAIAVLASALTNIVVLFPVAVMGGMIGRFLVPFATTMIVVTAVSLFVSFTLTPMLASKLLRARAADGRRRGMDRLAGAQRRAMARLSTFYGRGLAWLGRHRWAIVLLLVGVCGLVVAVGGQSGKLGFSLVAESDKGELYVKLEYPTRSGSMKVVELTALLHLSAACLSSAGGPSRSARSFSAPWSTTQAARASGGWRTTASGRRPPARGPRPSRSHCPPQTPLLDLPNPLFTCARSAVRSSPFHESPPSRAGTARWLDLSGGRFRARSPESAPRAACHPAATAGLLSLGSPPRRRWSAAVPATSK